MTVNGSYKYNYLDVKELVIKLIILFQFWPDNQQLLNLINQIKIKQFYSSLCQCLLYIQQLEGEFCS